MTRALEEELGGEMEEFLKLLGDPPELGNVPPDFWETMTVSMVATIRPVLERAALMAAKRIMLGSD